LILLSTLLLAVFLTIALIPLCSRLAFALNAVDIPDARRVHSKPTPRSGGMAMALGVFIPVLLWVPLDTFAKTFLVSAALIVLFGLLDDIRSLPYQAKFGAQWAAALIVVLWGGIEIRSLGEILPTGMHLPHWLGASLATFVIVGVTNAVNLSDGLDGLAGGISMLGFICIGFMAYEGGEATTTLLSIAFVGAVFGFLRFNTYPANLFMGDAGSQLLGFAAITLALRISQPPTALSPLMPLILLGFQVLDTLAVMTERIASGRSPFKPDKNHFHHKLMRLGLAHKEAVFAIYVIQAFLVSIAFLLRYRSEWFLLISYAAFSGVILVGFHTAHRTGWQWRRHDFIDGFIRERLRSFREKAFVIRASFRIVESGLPALLLLTWLVPSKVPGYISILSLACAALMGLFRAFRREWSGGLLRLGLYMTIPFAAYLSETDPSGWIPEVFLASYNILFGVLVLFVVMTLKFTRRSQGFRTTPMDFLIIFVTLVIPNLPDAELHRYSMGLLTAKIIVFFFSYEVLMGELRGHFESLSHTSLGILLLVSLRGLLGFR
jgi:UDP-GlcNAc:undecaprenyl-phosphate GlcNAc-1-phosphate transferase